MATLCLVSGDALSRLTGGALSHLIGDALSRLTSDALSRLTGNSLSLHWRRPTRLTRNAVDLQQPALLGVILLDQVSDDINSSRRLDPRIVVILKDELHLF
jgi:hypothetical protein